MAAPGGRRPGCIRWMSGSSRPLPRAGRSARRVRRTQSLRAPRARGRTRLSARRAAAGRAALGGPSAGRPRPGPRAHQRRSRPPRPGSVSGRARRSVSDPIRSITAYPLSDDTRSLTVNLNHSRQGRTDGVARDASDAALTLLRFMAGAVRGAAMPAPTREHRDTWHHALNCRIPSLNAVTSLWTDIHPGERTERLETWSRELLRFAATYPALAAVAFAAPGPCQPRPQPLKKGRVP
jgi:hypothetical protein